jgi:hypothetical protein
MLTAIYLFVGFFCGVGAMMHYSVLTGFIIWATSALSVIATGGTIVGARSRGAVYTVGSVTFGLVLLALTYWLTTKFSLTIFQWHLSGLTWALIGCAIGCWWGWATKPEPS